MSSSTTISRPFLDKLREIGWKVIDQGIYCGEVYGRDGEDDGKNSY